MATPLRLVLALVVAVGCGSSQPAEAPLAPSQPSKAESEPPPDLSPVAAPRDLFAVARIAQPGKLADLAMRWAGLPFDWRSLLAKEVPGIEGALAFDAPVDVAAVLDPSAGMEPKVLGAVSIGITSVDQALLFFRRRGDSVRKLAPHIYRVRPAAEITCIAAPAVGSAVGQSARSEAPAHQAIGRLVCSFDEDAAVALTPYMTRGLPREQLSESDLHLRVIAEPFQRRFGPMISLMRTAGVPFVMREFGLDHPAFDRALKDVLYGLVDEAVDVFADLDQLALDVTIDAKAEAVDGALAFKLKGQKSWVSQTIVAANAQAAPAPDAFFRLPADAVGANYSAYNEPQRFQKAAKALGQLLNGALDYFELSEKRRAPVVDAFEQALLLGGKSVYAELPSSEVLSRSKELGETDRLRSGLRHAVGYHLFAVQGDAGAYRQLLEALVGALDDKPFTRRLAKLELFDGEVPRLKKRAPRAAAKLPPGSTVFELILPATLLTRPFSLKEQGVAAAAPKEKTDPRAKKAEKPEAKKKDKPEYVSIFAAVVQHGGWTWVGVGADENGLYERLAAVTTGTGEGGLGTRAELAPFKTEPAVSAGFTTIRGALGSGVDSDRAFARAVDFERALSAMPQQGMTPIPWRATASAKGPVLTIAIRATGPVFRDAAAGFAAGMAGTKF